MQTNCRLAAVHVPAPPPAAAALDELAMLGGLVGAVDVQRQRADVVEIEHIDAGRLQALGGRHRARHRPLDALADTGQTVDEVIGGRARADADHLAFRHEFERRLGGAALGEILIAHVCLRAIPGKCHCVE
jgi:hypothetical protein